MNDAKPITRNSFLILAYSFLICLGTTDGDDGFTYKTVTFSGLEAPGIPGNVQYESFTSPAINNSGEIACRIVNSFLMEMSKH